MALINERDASTLRDRFAQDLVNPVKIVYFTQGETVSGLPGQPCETCRDTQQILEEVSQLSDKLSLEVHDFVGESDLARQYGIDKIPGTVMESDGRRLRYYGMPSGYEFSLLIEALLNVSRGTTDLSARSKEQLKSVQKPVHVEVMVTPT